MDTHTHTHTRRFNGPLSRTTWVSQYQKGKPIWILLKQETVSGSDNSWAICKSAPCSRQITTPAPHHSVFYRPDALPDAQPTASRHWRHNECRAQTSRNHRSIRTQDTLHLTDEDIAAISDSWHRQRTSHVVVFEHVMIQHKTVVLQCTSITQTQTYRNSTLLPACGPVTTSLEHKQTTTTTSV